ncbi:uncharacterized protein G2W53_042339 [Senna tora]|uniref:Uncharacterized protein n=1 Tax=Senna tora TaxID=362788 RepID=A0A834SFV5_9FABA|nr:uncharacterized protein G2W53_042339 [Senna tora]
MGKKMELENRRRIIPNDKSSMTLAPILTNPSLQKLAFS